MIHILFSSSAAGTLRRVLHARGRRERVVDLTEFLDWGPIATSNFEDRVSWLDRRVPSNLGGWKWIIEGVAEFRERAAADSDRLIWIAPRSAHEQSGLHWYLDQFGGTGSEMIVADYALQDAWRGEPPLGLGELGERQIAELLDKCARLPSDLSRFPAARWRSLIADDALLRIVDDGLLRSAPENYFDRFLLERCSAGWAKWQRVVGNAMVDIMDTGHSADDLLLFWRLCELIQRREIACNGELPRYVDGSRDTVMVRLAQ
jgi:hypothetical protein